MSLPAQLFCYDCFSSARPCSKHTNYASFDIPIHPDTKRLDWVLKWLHMSGEPGLSEVLFRAGWEAPCAPDRELIDRAMTPPLPKEIPWRPSSYDGWEHRLNAAGQHELRPVQEKAKR